VEDCLATIQTVDVSITGLDNDPAGILRVWLWVAEIPNNSLPRFLVDLGYFLVTGYAAFHLLCRLETEFVVTCAEGPPFALCGPLGIMLKIITSVYTVDRRYNF